MVMNEISMSQTWLYNISYQKATRFLQEPVPTEGTCTPQSSYLLSLDC